MDSGSYPGTEARPARLKSAGCVARARDDAPQRKRTAPMATLRRLPHCRHSCRVGRRSSRRCPMASPTALRLPQAPRPHGSRPRYVRIRIGEPRTLFAHPTGSAVVYRGPRLPMSSGDSVSQKARTLCTPGRRVRSTHAQIARPLDPHRAARPVSRAAQRAPGRSARSVRRGRHDAETHAGTTPDSPDPSDGCNSRPIRYTGGPNRV